MIIVEDWILESRNIRTEHIDLIDPCIERGGNSTVHRGVLAQYLNTNFPSKIDLCHACHNGLCSNPKHLYWGTRKENIRDMKDNGNWKSAWQMYVEKHGLEAALLHIRSISDPSKAGKATKGIPKSEEHKRKISETLKNKNVLTLNIK